MWDLVGLQHSKWTKGLPPTENIINNIRIYKGKGKENFCPMRICLCLKFYREEWWDGHASEPKENSEPTNPFSMTLMFKKLLNCRKKNDTKSKQPEEKCFPNFEDVWCPAAHLFKYSGLLSTDKHWKHWDAKCRQIMHFINYWKADLYLVLQTSKEEFLAFLDYKKLEANPSVWNN